MAKLKAPLLSFGARGQLGKSIVYFPWKGIDCVREYVIPANPRTTAQLAQRAHMTAALVEWHGAVYTALDATAWNRYAGILAKIMAGFNSMVKVFIDEKILANVWTRIHDGQSYGAGAAGFSVQCTKVSGGLVPSVHYGTRKTHFPDSQVLADQGGDVWAATLAGLSASTLYYFYFAVGVSAATYGRTGIYQQRTTA